METHSGPRISMARNMDLDMLDATAVAQTPPAHFAAAMASRAPGNNTNNGVVDRSLPEDPFVDATPAPTAIATAAASLTPHVNDNTDAAAAVDSDVATMSASGSRTLDNALIDPALLTLAPVVPAVVLQQQEDVNAVAVNSSPALLLNESANVESSVGQSSASQTPDPDLTIKPGMLKSILKKPTSTATSSAAPPRDSSTPKRDDATTTPTKRDATNKQQTPLLHRYSSPPRLETQDHRSQLALLSSSPGHWNIDLLLRQHLAAADAIADTIERIYAHAARAEQFALRVAKAQSGKVRDRRMVWLMSRIILGKDGEYLNKAMEELQSTQDNMCKLERELGVLARKSAREGGRGGASAAEREHDMYELLEGFLGAVAGSRGADRTTWCASGVELGEMLDELRADVEWWDKDDDDE